MLIVTILLPDREAWIKILPLLEEIEERVGKLDPSSDDPEDAVLVTEELDEEGEGGEDYQGQFVLGMLGVDPNRKMPLRAFSDLTTNFPINPLTLN